MTDDATEEPTGAASEPWRLDHFLKMNCLTESGGQAKFLIQGGEVRVNGVVETRRRRKLAAGDVIEIGTEKLVVPN